MQKSDFNGAAKKRLFSKVPEFADAKEIVLIAGLGLQANGGAKFTAEDNEMMASVSSEGAYPRGRGIGTARQMMGLAPATPAKVPNKKRNPASKSAPKKAPTIAVKAKRKSLKPIVSKECNFATAASKLRAIADQLEQHSSNGESLLRTADLVLEQVA